jgi:hypothetical protein
MYYASIQTAADRLPRQSEIAQICDESDVRIVEFTESDDNDECWTEAHVILMLQADEDLLQRLGYIDIMLDDDLSLHIELA